MAKKPKKPTYRELEKLLGVHQVQFERVMQLANSFADQRDALQAELKTAQGDIERYIRNEKYLSSALAEAGQIRRNSDANILRLFHSERR